jgi:hypothetical protein
VPRKEKKEKEKKNGHFSEKEKKNISHFSKSHSLFALSLSFSDYKTSLKRRASGNARRREEELISLSRVWKKRRRAGRCGKP